jgi:murein DD-endopeptidase MepM/ murein hydrolase activator NlpD
VKRLSPRAEANRTRRWAPLLAFLSVGGLAVVAGIPSFAAADYSNDASFARSAESEQSVTGTSGRQGSQRDGISAMAGFGSAGGRSLASFTNNPNGTIQWPFAVTVPISDLYGAREAPCVGCSSMHGGIDFDAGEGYPIQVIADGVVTKVQPLDDNWGDGVYVEITHSVNGQSILSRYCHLLSGSITVSEGQAVRVGQLLAQVGDTGATTGAHLHFEIHANGSPINPYTWLTENAN